MIKKYLLVILVVFSITIGSGLSSMGKNAPSQKQSAEELKIMQVRTYDKVNYNKLMKATLNVLQNDCYFIEQADSQVGFILANIEFDTRDEYIDIKKEFGCSNKFLGIKRFFPFLPSYARTEADINVTTECDKSTIKISFRKKIFNLYDSAIKVENVTDKTIYNKFYSDLDKELQIKGNK